MDRSELNDKPAVQAAVRQVADEYLQDPNVTSVGIGYKMVDGKPTDELALQFTVGQKIAPEGLEAASTTPIPESITVNGMTFATDVLERDFQVQPVAVATEAKPDRKRRLDPMVPGVSVGYVHPSRPGDLTAGTLGCLVRESAGGKIRMLSNWHVLHGANGNLGDPIAQPGPFDDNRDAGKNRCGKLVRSFLGLAGDCAIGSVEGRAATEDALELGVPVRQIGDPELGDRVVKSGRSTAVTHGLVTRVHTITRVNYDGVGIRKVGSFEIGPDPDNPAANGEISISGDSGSAWMAVDSNGEATEMMLGLHFAGETGSEPEHAAACYASSVFEKLEISPLDAAAPDAVVVTGPSEGYDPRFLPGDYVVDFPSAVDSAVEGDYAPTKGGELVRHCTHFSLAMSAGRRFCRWVAWNIDGSSLLKLSREDLDFVLDDAYEAKYQVDNRLYANNPLDRGHIARRADLVWGSREEAERANKYSFLFTNIAPHLDSFNQSSKHGLWGEVENEIFAAVDVEDLRVSVFGGPLFKDTDFPYRGVLVPRSFWKAIAYVEDGALKAKAYVLTQDDLEEKLESLGLEQFNLYQVALQELSAMTGLDYGPMTAADTMGIGVEAAGTPVVRRVEARSEIVAE